VKTLPKIIVSLSLLLPFCAGWARNTSQSAIMARSFEQATASNILSRSTKTRLATQPAKPKRAVATELNRTILERIERFHHLVDGYSEIHELDPDLVRAVIYVESGGDPRAVSPRGASGLMQLMPQSFADLGDDERFDPEINISSGTRYLREMLDRFQSVEAALWAYNAGPTAVEREFMPLETREYVPRVLRIRGLRVQVLLGAPIKTRGYE
jgi:soluble lytic murein transglycosylase-like protein